MGKNQSDEVTLLALGMRWREGKQLGSSAVGVGSSHLPLQGQVSVSHWTSGWSGHSKAGWRSLLIRAKHHHQQLCALWHPAFEVTENQDTDMRWPLSFFHWTRAAMERTLLKTLLLLFAVMLVATQAKNVRLCLYFELIWHCILVAWTKKKLLLSFI